MEELGLVLFLHPARSLAAEQLVDYGLEFNLGFMFDSSITALRLVVSGIAYLQEFVFRSNRRSSRQRGPVFYRLLQQAIQVDPVPFGRLIARRS